METVGAERAHASAQGSESRHQFVGAGREVELIRQLRTRLRVGVQDLPFAVEDDDALAESVEQRLRQRREDGRRGGLEGLHSPFLTGDPLKWFQRGTPRKSLVFNHLRGGLRARET